MMEAAGVEPSRPLGSRDFEVSINCRFWVSTEDKHKRAAALLKDGDVTAASGTSLARRVVSYQPNWRFSAACADAPAQSCKRNQTLTGPSDATKLRAQLAAV